MSVILYTQKSERSISIMSETCYCTTENNRYLNYEKQSKSRINRRCIDGTVTGCGNCVGYCQYREHPGFLTENLRKEHDCINKQCYYYIAKPQRTKIEKNKDISIVLMDLARKLSADIDDFRVINAYQTEIGWVIGYITVFSKQSYSNIANAIQKTVGIQVMMKKMNYTFERCVELICEK